MKRDRMEAAISRAGSRRRTAIYATACLAATLGATAAPAQNAQATVDRVMTSVEFGRAMAAIARDHDRLVSEIVQITEIPAPPFKEEARGTAYLAMLRQHGLTDVERDGAGNVMGLRRGTAPVGAPLVAVVAHLDTVFPEGTDVRVRREGTRLAAPGVGDNSRSLAVVLAMIRAMDEAGVRTRSDILFVGDVGEEGLGDLRGVRYLLTEGKYKDRIRQVIAIDGPGRGDEIVNAAVGSRRFEVTFDGPGGHSYNAFGLVSPAFAMGAAMERLGRIAVPTSPKTTFNVGRVWGGTSVNTIPKSMTMEVDMRSESPVELDKLERAFRAAVQQAVDDENRTRSTSEGRVTATYKPIGNRPSGITPPDTPLVSYAVEAAKAAGLRPVLDASSTDANLPISLGIPAIRLNSGGTGDRAHAADEWIDVEPNASVTGIRVILATLLAAAGGS